MAQSAARAAGAFIPEWSFADKFRKARQVAGMEQRAFAEALDLSASTVAAYETGRANPRFRAVLPLAKRIQLLTGIDYRWFLDAPVETQKAPDLAVEGLSLPGLDSNQEPADSQPDRVVHVDFARRTVVA